MGGRDFILQLLLPEPKIYMKNVSSSMVEGPPLASAAVSPLPLPFAAAPLPLPLAAPAAPGLVAPIRSRTALRLAYEEGPKKTAARGPGANVKPLAIWGWGAG